MHLAFRTLAQCLLASCALGTAAPKLAAREPAQAQEAPVANPVEEMEALKARTTTFSDLAITPDGSRLAWKAVKGTSRGEVFIMDRTRLEQGAYRVGRGSSPVWCGDSRQMAYLATADGTDQSQLWIVDAQERRPRTFMNLHGYVAQGTQPHPREAGLAQWHDLAEP
jgi:hypothetical protein